MLVVALFLVTGGQPLGGLGSPHHDTGKNTNPPPTIIRLRSQTVDWDVTEAGEV